MRTTMFGGKVGGKRISVSLTPEVVGWLDEARDRLSDGYTAATGKRKRPSDAEVLEWLIRCERWYRVGLFSGRSPDFSAVQTYGLADSGGRGESADPELAKP